MYYCSKVTHALGFSYLSYVVFVHVV